MSILGYKQVTEQELFLGNFVADVVEGINHLKNVEASQQQKGIELLNKCNLSAFSKLASKEHKVGGTEPGANPHIVSTQKAMTDTTISWNYFHQTLAEVEVS